MRPEIDVQSLLQRELNAVFVEGSPYVTREWLLDKGFNESFAHFSKRINKSYSVFVSLVNESNPLLYVSIGDDGHLSFTHLHNLNNEGKPLSRYKVLYICNIFNL